jgi:hypothetical protein
MGLVRTLKEHENLIVEISAYTDSRDNDAANDILSQKRAEAVVEFLKSQGIDTLRMVAKGYGERMPRQLDKEYVVNRSAFHKGVVLDDLYINTLSGDEKEDAHQLNRRIAFKVIGDNFKKAEGRRQKEEVKGEGKGKSEGVVGRPVAVVAKKPESEVKKTESVVTNAETVYRTAVPAAKTPEPVKTKPEPVVEKTPPVEKKAEPIVKKAEPVIAKPVAQEKKTEPVKPTVISPAGKFTVQVGTGKITPQLSGNFKDLKACEGPDKIIRIITGSFSTKEEASAFCKEAKKFVPDAFVAPIDDKRSNCR